MFNKLNLTGDSWVSVLKGGAIAAAGAALTYLAAHMGNLDFGSLTPVVVAGLSVVVNYLRKLVTDVQTPPVQPK